MEEHSIDQDVWRPGPFWPVTTPLFQRVVTQSIIAPPHPALLFFFVRDGIKFRADYNSARVVSCVVGRGSCVVRFFFDNGIFSKRIELEGWNFVWGLKTKKMRQNERYMKIDPSQPPKTTPTHPNHPRMLTWAIFIQFWWNFAYKSIQGRFEGIWREILIQSVLTLLYHPRLTTPTTPKC